MTSNASALAKQPLALLLLGATGRTGVPFLHRALERGHRVTVYVRNAKKLPTELVANPLLTCVEGQLDDDARFVSAYNTCKPNVIVSMLASDQKPHTGWTSAARLLQTACRQSTSAGSPQQVIAIGATGVGGKAEAVVSKWWTFRFIFGVAGFFASKVVSDFRDGVYQLEQMRKQGILRITFIQPTWITNGPRTDKYESFTDENDGANRIGLFDTISRNDIADLALKLAEQSGAGEEIPEYVIIRNP